MSHRDPGVIYDQAFARQAKNRNFVSTLAIDGRIVGEWKPLFDQDAVVIAAAPFATLTEAGHRALKAAAHRYGEFFGARVSYQSLA